MKAEMKIIIAVMSVFAIGIAGLMVIDDNDASTPLTSEDLKTNPDIMTVTNNGVTLEYQLFAEQTLTLGTAPQDPTSTSVLVISSSDGNSYNVPSMDATYAGDNVIYIYTDPETGVITYYVKVYLTGTFTNTSNNNSIYVKNVVGYAKVNFTPWTVVIDDITYDGKKHDMPYNNQKIISGDVETTANLVYVSGDKQKTNVGTYTTTVSIEGQKWFGETEVEWKIVPKSINDPSVVKKVDPESIKAGDPKVLIIDTAIKNKKLVANVDYYESIISVDPVSIFVEGIGNYTDTDTVGYEIIEGDLHVNTINQTGPMSKDTFEGQISIWNGRFGTFIESKNYTIAVWNGWGELVFSDNEDVLKEAEKKGITPTLTTTTEWNYMDLYGNPEEQYGGHVEGSFYVNLNTNYYEVGASFTVDGINYTVTSIDKKTACVDGYGIGISSNLIIPDFVNGFKVTKIEEKAFYGCKTITSVEIGDYVTSIGVKAFTNCTNVKTVAFGDSVKTISAYAFYNCSKLQSIDMPDTVKTVGSYAFYKCGALTSVAFDDNLKTVGSNAFSVTFKNAAGKTISKTAANLAGHTFEGSDKVLKLIA